MTTSDVRSTPFHVLLIEDNPDHAELISRSLEQAEADVRIQHFTNGQDALDYLFQEGRFSNPTLYIQPQIVLLDLRLPKIDGLEVLRRIKADPEVRNLPVVVLTTSEDPNDIRQAYHHYTNSYLVKPSGFDKLSDMLRHTEQYWRIYNHSPSDSINAESAAAKAQPSREQ